MFREVMTNSVCNLLLKNERETPDQIYLRQPRDGQWIHFTWAEVVLRARKVAAFLQQKGLKKGSHISIISKNCAEWFITDFGINLAGMVSVPLFANQQEDSIHYVLQHADVKLVFVGKLDDHLRVRDFVPLQYPTASFDYHSDMVVDYRWSDIMATDPLKDIVHPEPEDLYTIIYSSGTSGSPKGAMYTHQTVANYLSIFPDDLNRIRQLDFYKLISYLPLAHVYERSAIQLGSLTIRCDVSFVESLDKFADNLREIKPTFFTAVPRIWGVFQQKIEQKLPARKLNFLLKIPFVSSLIKKKIVHGLGLENCANSFSGASHLPVPIIQFFDKLGIPIQEGYGQTENLAYATLSLLDERRLGYVGTPRLLVEIKTSETQELLLKSPCLMKGYYKDEAASEKAFTADGWLRTGDLVEIDELQRVKITGRVSEIFKNQTGEYVAPTPIEKRFSGKGMIEQLCLVGQSLPSNVMLISLSKEAVEAMKKPDIKRELQNNLHDTNSSLAKFEKISHVIVVKDPWTTDNGLLTPTMKVKRKAVAERYEGIIKEALQDHQTVIWE
ncbi:MAG: AMP-binding protein [Legionella sp.]|nr:MAG: AMP-binding protein [Legionella sp.]